MSGFSFKKELSQNDGEFKPLPPGVYDVQFDTLEEKSTLSGGVQWVAKMKIVGSGRTFFLSWNVENKSAVAQRIAREQISQIANLLGVGDDISIESIKTNKIFTITLEQRQVDDKTFYQTKGPWKLSDAANKSLSSGVKLAQEILKTDAPVKKVPWGVK